MWKNTLMKFSVNWDGDCCQTTVRSKHQELTMPSVSLRKRAQGLRADFKCKKCTSDVMEMTVGWEKRQSCSRLLC